MFLNVYACVYIYVCMCLHVCLCAYLLVHIYTICMQVSLERRRRSWILWNWSTGDLGATWWGYWKLNLDYLQEQQVVLLAETSLQPSQIVLYVNVHKPKNNKYSIDYSYTNFTFSVAAIFEEFYNVFLKHYIMKFLSTEALPYNYS